MNYHHLFYFWTIATEGSIAKASKKLRIGQPTLSTQLKQLESSLEQPLFERRNRQLILTEAGRIALEHANEIFRLGSELREALADRPSIAGKRYHIQIGALDSVPKSVVARLAEAALSRDCQVSILEGKGDELIRELSAHRVDLLLLNHPPSLADGQHLMAKSLGRFVVGIYGSETFRGLSRGFPQSLRGQKFVLPTFHSKLRHDLDHYFRLNQIAISPVAETQDTSLQKLLGQTGAGLLPLTEEAAAELVRAKVLFEIGRLPGVHEEYWLVMVERKIRNPIAGDLYGSFALGVHRKN
jgi:LysR family transcriptional activator of nhaA